MDGTKSPYHGRVQNIYILKRIEGKSLWRRKYWHWLERCLEKICGKE